jgi:hypothetical protein
MATARTTACSGGRNHSPGHVRLLQEFTTTASPRLNLTLTVSPSVSKPVISVRSRQLSARDQCNWRIGASKQDGLAPPRHVRYPRWPARKTAGESHHGVGSRCDASGIRSQHPGDRAPRHSGVRTRKKAAQVHLARDRARPFWAAVFDGRRVYVHPAAAADPPARRFGWRVAPPAGA